MLRKKGFTILELLIVIAVISILVGIALPRFKGMQDEGNIARAKGELRMLQTAVESYYMHNSNKLPANLRALTTATPQLVPSVLPNDPFSGSSYGYNKKSPYFVVYSVGTGGNGSATVDANGAINESNGSSCIYMTNGASVDTTP